MRRGQKQFYDSDYFNVEVALNELLGSLSPTGNSSVSSVNDSASNQTLLSANTDRKGLILFNNSSSIAYVKFGATATTTDFTIRLVPYATYTSTPPVYSGRIDCIWSADSTGAILITELT